MASVLKRALQVAVEQEKKRRFASGVKCQPNATPRRARFPMRSGSRCSRATALRTFVGADGDAAAPRGGSNSIT